MMMAGISGQRFMFNRHESDSPVFDRQMSGDDYVELQQCKAMMESMQQRLGKLEKINLDLEHRLEDQAKQNLAMETECISIERKCKSKCEQLETVINKLNTELETEKMKNNRLREQVSRTEKELYGILQRKYELMRGGPTSAISAKGGPKQSSSAPPTETSSLLRKSDAGGSDEFDLFQMSKVRKLLLIHGLINSNNQLCTVRHPFQKNHDDYEKRKH